MKISKKILIPVFASAMGLSAIGGISGAVAWYQFNTKAEASWVGASVADGGSLLISNDSGSTWERSIVFGDGSDTLHPCTFGAMTATSALPSNAYRHPEYGVEDMTQWDAAVAGTDYVQYTFMLKVNKIVNNAYTGVEAAVNIDSFVLRAVENGMTVANAVRVHFASSAGNKLYSLAGGTTATHGSLDLNGDTKADYHGGYSWDADFDDVYDYGDDGSQVHTALAAGSFLTVPAAGLEVTLTIWLEGWHSFAANDKSMWAPETTGGATIQFGITFSVADDVLLDD